MVSGLAGEKGVQLGILRAVIRCARAVQIISVDLSVTRLRSLCGRPCRKASILTTHIFGTYDFTQYMMFWRKRLYSVSLVRKSTEIICPAVSISVAINQAQSNEVEDAVLAIRYKFLRCIFPLEAEEKTIIFY